MPFARFACRRGRRFPEVPGRARGGASPGWRTAILSNTDRDLVVAFQGADRASRSTRRSSPPRSGSYKPGHRHWSEFFARTHCRPCRAMFNVAASLFHDVAPCAELGLRSVWVNRLGETADPVPTKEVTDLSGLADVARPTRAGVNAPAGFTVRPGRPDDAAVAADLMKRLWTRAYVDEPDTVDAAEVSGWWERIELDRDSRFYFRRRRPAGRHRWRCYSRTRNCLDPRRLRASRVCGPTVLGGADGRLAGGRDGTSRRNCCARTSALAADRAAVQLLGDHGYESIRHFYRMSIDLAAPPRRSRSGRRASRSRPLQPGEEEILHAVIRRPSPSLGPRATAVRGVGGSTTASGSGWDPSLRPNLRPRGRRGWSRPR